MPNLDTFVNQRGPYTATYINGLGQIGNQSTGMSSAKATTMYRSSVNTRNFYNLADRDQLPYNAFTFRKTEVRGQYGTYRVQSKTTKEAQIYSGFIESVVISNHSLRTALSASHFSQADAEAINRVLLQMKDQKVNLSQAMAERQQLINMVATNAKRIAGAMSNLKKGNFSGAAENLGIKAGRKARSRYGKGFANNQSQAVASGWLELQYGWKPLLGDIYGAADAIASARYGTPRIRASSRATRQNSEVLSDPTMPKGQQTIPRTSVIDSTVDVNYNIQFTMQNDLMHTATALGLTNPALIAWELMPYSFVVDWFFPMGNWISALDATLGLSFSGGSKTTFQRTRMHTTCGGTADRTYDVMTGSSEGYQEYIEVSRVTLTSFPMLKPPSFKNPFTVGHALNGLALVTKLFRK